jgi:predicted DsbA family dithiol-disulfide isomerase
MIKLDILSDPICPWCYIGKTNLDRALAERPPVFEIEWHPFQLDPSMPREGMDRRDYLEAKFGSRENIIRMHKPLLEAAENAGVTIDFAAITRTPNTLDAHRLIHWAGLEERQKPVVDALFRGYFTEGVDIGDAAVLAAIAESAGMDRSVIERLLASDADVENVRNRDAHSREMGVNGVPTFIVGQRHVVSGAQPRELWLQVIDELLGLSGAGSSASLH